MVRYCLRTICGSWDFTCGCSRLCPFYSPLFIFFHHVSALPSPPMQPLHVLLPLLLRSTIFRFQISNFKFKFKSTGYVGRFQSMLILSCCRAILTPGYQTVCNSFRFHTNRLSLVLIKAHFTW
ncbi:hypothetical protein AAZX31_18G116500 [Glycine max]